MKPLQWVVAVTLLASLPGCGRHGATGVALFTAGVFAGAAIAAEHDNDEARYERERDEAYPYATRVIIVQPAATIAPAAVPAIPPPPPFDAKRARTALAEIDVARCREVGAPRGYGHARVTFNPAGDISKVVVDEPSTLSAPAVRCVGEAIGRATVPEFSGSLVTVGTTWFVP